MRQTASKTDIQPMIPIAVCGMSFKTVLAVPYGKFDRASYGNRRQKSNYIQDTEVLFCFIWVLNRA